MPEYLKNKDLYRELCISKDQDKLTKEAERMMILVAQNIGKKFYYKNEEDRKDCVQQAIFILLLRWRSYDVTRTNAFAWVSQVVKIAMAGQFNQLVQKDRTTGEIPQVTNFSKLFSNEDEVNV